MRQIPAHRVTQTVARLCIEANYYLPSDVLAALRRARDQEPSSVGQEILAQLLQNAAIAAQGEYPLCQDCGTAVVWLELGQDAHVIGQDLYAAVQEGVRQGYTQGYLRASIVERPFSARANTGDNTPAVIHTHIVPGDQLRIVVAPKGGGSENMSALGMLKPADGRQGVIDFVTETVDRAGAKPCPPLIVCVGIGGNAEQAMIMAKHAGLRPVGTPHPDRETAELEGALLARINALGIGPQGLGGRTTALAVHAETAPCHITGLPVGVNLLCHAARHAEAVL
ncbi:MAG: fumarate hydratase [Anaerolineae bacterium]|nr:fumarate hydratase [Anaerolineae bacterium]